ncbi:HNH endonuclease [Hoyosella sp. YIM 151337]|uniref:HNH endonuclease signature motif containing protein n=1 Tax=Hoyosella sp. YIM 151337 TaxID=2992742 RepID=UPI0022365A11|nr:HNH endonuclease signature motif containing protein [Hoyosella sp. YIM 151337]MCW4353221.1 HNH endonuclease [Hoyosella sp. YIM 151337]
MFDTLVGALDGVGSGGFAGVDDAGVIEVAAVWHRLEGVVAERTLAAVAEVFRRFQVEAAEAAGGVADEWVVVDAFDRAEAEIGAALGIGRRAAGGLVGLADALARRLPGTRALLAAGVLSVYQARQLESLTANVGDEVIEEVEREVLERVVAGGAVASGRRLRDMVDRVIVARDPEGLRVRRERAQQDRYVQVSAAEDGMVSLLGSLRADEGRFLDARLSEMAKQVCAGDPRGFAVRRADALVALMHGEDRLGCRCGSEDCPAGGAVPPPARRKPLIHVITTDTAVSYASASRTNGARSAGRTAVEDASPAQFEPSLEPHEADPEPPDADGLGYLDGYGLIDGAFVRELAAGGVIRALRFGGDGEPGDSSDGDGHSDDSGSLRYRPREEVGDAARALHGGCLWPQCDGAAWECDLDHHEAFDREEPDAGGQTVLDNLGPLCRGHHTHKTSGGWRIERSSCGALVLIAPSGLSYTVYPHGPVSLLTEPGTSAVSGAANSGGAGNGNPACAAEVPGQPGTEIRTSVDAPNVDDAREDPPNYCTSNNCAPTNCAPIDAPISDTPARETDPKSGESRSCRKQPIVPLMKRTKNRSRMQNRAARIRRERNMNRAARQQREDSAGTEPPF